MTRHDAERRRKILESIARIVAERGYPPSVREIAEADAKCVGQNEILLDGDVEHAPELVGRQFSIVDLEPQG